MNGCAKVKSPIQRTNLMMKDPDYRNCYKLWQFIESYDEVGYSIEEQDTALEFDEEYQTQMYINLITNYTISFVGVADYIFLICLVHGGKFPLSACGESSAASSSKA